MSTKLTALPANAAPSLDDLLYLVRTADGESMSVLVSALATLIGAGGAVASVDGRTGIVTLNDLYDAIGSAAAVVDGAPADLNTLNELAASIGDDPNFVGTIAAALALLAPLANPTFTGNVVVPDADAATEALNRQTGDARYALKAYGTFVRKVRQTLTDKTSFAGTGSEQVGTEEAVLDDADLPILTGVTVHARAPFTATNSSSATSLSALVEISLDGGATWSSGTPQSTRDGAGSATTNGRGMGPEHQVTGTVTGDIQARLMVSCSTGAGTAWDVVSAVIYMDVIVPLV